MDKEISAMLHAAEEEREHARRRKEMMDQLQKEQSMAPWKEKFRYTERGIWKYQRDFQNFYTKYS